MNPTLSQMARTLHDELEALPVKPPELLYGAYQHAMYDLEYESACPLYVFAIMTLGADESCLTPLTEYFSCTPMALEKFARHYDAWVKRQLKEVYYIPDDNLSSKGSVPFVFGLKVLARIANLP